MIMPVPSVVHWRKSARSGDTGGACVEVANASPEILVRDSKHPQGTRLVFGAVEWRRFSDRVKAGRYDLR